MKPSSFPGDDYGFTIFSNELTINPFFVISLWFNLLACELTMISLTDPRIIFEYTICCVNSKWMKFFKLTLILLTDWRIHYDYFCRQFTMNQLLFRDLTLNPKQIREIRYESTIYIFTTLRNLLQRKINYLCRERTMYS